MKITAGEIEFVKIPDRNFLMGRYPVTNCQYELFDPSHKRAETSPNDDSPVADVNWYQAWSFAKWIGWVMLDGERYRVGLPLESEWEHACRAGSTTEYCYGDDEARLGEYAWYEENSDGRAHPVGQKKPNDWGLYDMHGNVWEWCQDWFDESNRVVRGGSWFRHGWFCRSAFRFTNSPEDRGSWSRNDGFRLAAVPGSSAARR